MTQPNAFPTAQDYTMAIHSQSACNLSGIVFEFAQIMERICAQAHAEGHGTAWKNTHPICRLYAEQILHLAQGTEWRDAWHACTERANTEQPRDAVRDPA